VCDVTASNKSGRALTARAVRVADPRSALDWLQPRDKDETPLAVGETKKFTYGVSVKANAAPQTVKYRVDVVDVANPDEFFTQGPTVAVTVEAAVVVITKPWWKKALPYAVAALVVLGVGFGIYKLVVGGDKKVRVPVVVGQPWDTAGARLTRAGFVVANLKPNDVVPTNNQGLNETVKTITPADSVLDKGTTVSLTVFQFVPPPQPPGPRGGMVGVRADPTPFAQNLNRRRATTTVSPRDHRTPRDS